MNVFEISYLLYWLDFVNWFNQIGRVCRENRFGSIRLLGGGSGFSRFGSDWFLYLLLIHVQQSDHDWSLFKNYFFIFFFRLFLVSCNGLLSLFNLLRFFDLWNSMMDILRFLNLLFDRLCNWWYFLGLILDKWSIGILFDLFNSLLPRLLIFITV